jgi:hypothetical protein
MFTIRHGFTPRKDHAARNANWYWRIAARICDGCEQMKIQL